MKKIIINENQLNSIIEKIINEVENSTSSIKMNLNPNKLTIGAKGPEVSIIQQKLFDSGCLKTRAMKPTGYFGPLTADALKRYNESKDGKCVAQDKTSITKDVKGLQLSDTLSDMYKFDIQKNINRISSKDSVSNLINPKTNECAQFVNNLSDKYDYIGDAWLAHDNQKLGNLIYTAFNPLPKNKIQPIINAWKNIYKKGGPEPKYNKEIGDLIGSIVPNKINIQLQLDDIVGIYNPKSKHHEDALYNAGKPYFSTWAGLRSDPKPDDSLLSGQGFGMNTHVGIVGAIKNGVPIIFHNVIGTVMMDPYNRLSGGMKIAWVRRK